MDLTRPFNDLFKSWKTRQERLAMHSCRQREVFVMMTNRIHYQKVIDEAADYAAYADLCYPRIPYKPLLTSAFFFAASWLS